MVAKTPEPTTLLGAHVRLEPLTRAHVPDLLAAGGGDDEVWRWMPVTTPRTEDDMRAVVDQVLARGAGSVVLAVVDVRTGRAIGWSGYWDISAVDERLEIGWTWYGRAAWRTAVNTEAKLLMLTHAFEDLGMGRVAWKTDHLNERSQNAIKRLGARYEGTFRRQRRRPDGTWRDAVFFSMLADEWPAAKARLTAALERGTTAA